MKLNELIPDGASYELQTQRTQTSTVRYEGNRFDGISSADRMSQTVRLLHQGKLSTASGSEPDSAVKLLKQAVTMAPYGSPHTVPFVGAAKVPELHLVDETELSSKQMIEKLGDFVADLRAIDERLIVGAQLSSSLGEVALETSHGFAQSYRKSVWSCFAGMELVQGDDLLNLYEMQAAMGPDFDVKKMKDELAELLSYAKNVVPFTPGAYPVLFHPGEVANIINPVVQSLNGLAVYRQVSPWSDKLGQELLDPRFTLSDDGAADRTWTSAPFDNEGTPTRRNILVNQGCLGDLLLDRKVAALLGRESSGNAGAGAPTPHSLRLEPGSKSLDEMIRSIDYGLLIYNTMGAWSGNPYSGIVSGTISMGLKIEKGAIVGRVKDCMFTVNAFEHLRKNLLDLSSEVKQGNRNLFPYMLLDEVVISTK